MIAVLEPIWAVQAVTNIALCYCVFVLNRAMARLEKEVRK